ncbi:MAG: YsnF/AvaK domain-containing protein [Chloroflexota bacterium]|nr:YsnF/AvaK domain-containing protein [Chloroflexota bacterium]
MSGTSGNRMGGRKGGAATRQPAPRAGMSVRSNTSWTGRVTNVIAATAAEEGALRVAWDGDGETVVPLSTCTITDERIMVQFASDAESGNGARPGAMVMDRNSVTVPIIEEEIITETIWRESGSVMIRLRAEDLPRTFTEQTEHEELMVEQVDIGRVLADGEVVEPRQEGDRHIIPIVIEEAVIVKRRVLAHEMHITKRTVSATQTMETTVRRMYPEIESGALADRTHIAANIAQ